MSPSAASAASRPARLAGLRRRFLAGDRLLIVSGAVCVVMVLLATIGPPLAPYSPDKIDILNQNAAPSWSHLFGTDSLGRDIFSRALYAAPLSLLGAGMVMMAAVAAGSALAIAGAWLGGWFDRIVVRIIDVWFAFPAILIAILVVAITSPGLVGCVIAISIGYTPLVARIIRTVALRERHLGYIESCQLLGYSGWRICSGHILPNVRGMIIAQAAICFGSALLDLGALSFLGLGVQPPVADWGVMVGDGGSELLNGYPQQAFVAGALIVITVVAFNVLGERLERRAAEDTR